jgi:hypothetical protein
MRRVSARSSATPRVSRFQHVEKSDELPCTIYDNDPRRKKRERKLSVSLFLLAKRSFSWIGKISSHWLVYCAIFALFYHAWSTQHIFVSRSLLLNQEQEEVAYFPSSLALSFPKRPETTSGFSLPETLNDALLEDFSFVDYGNLFIDVFEENGMKRSIYHDFHLDERKRDREVRSKKDDVES